MKVVIVIAALMAALVCIKVITAAPVACSTCSVKPVSSTGPCAYCLTATTPSRLDNLGALFMKNDYFLGVLMDIVSLYTTPP